MDINFENFSKFNIVVGTIVNAELNVKAIKPAYILNIDFCCLLRLDESNEIGKIEI